MKKVLIVINSYFESDAYINQAKRMKEEFEKQGVSADIKKSYECYCEISDNSIKSKIDGYAFCVYFDNDKYVLEMLESIGLKVYNSRKSIYVCDDKMRTYSALANNGINIPNTIPGAICEDESISVKKEIVDAVEQRFGYPVIVKKSFGTFGNGVYKAKNRAELELLCEKVKNCPHHFQEYIKSSEGRDIRVIVVGKKFVAAMLRRSDDDFRSNLECGGIGLPIYIPDSFKKVAEKVAKILSLDFCGIDLLFGKNGEPIVCEVHSYSFLDEIESVCGVNIAEIYTKYLIKQSTIKAVFPFNGR